MTRFVSCLNPKALKLDDPSWKKEATDIGPEDDPVKAEIVELDI
jgi:hypothetical protein